VVDRHRDVGARHSRALGGDAGPLPGKVNDLPSVFERTPLTSASVTTRSRSAYRKIGLLTLVRWCEFHSISLSEPLAFSWICASCRYSAAEPEIRDSTQRRRVDPPVRVRHAVPSTLQHSPRSVGAFSSAVEFAFHTVVALRKATSPTLMESGNHSRPRGGSLPDSGSAG
jgi:hypothetical protein